MIELQSGGKVQAGAPINREVVVSLTMRKSRTKATARAMIPMSRSRMGAAGRRTKSRLRPLVGQARTGARQRLESLRYWAVPRLNRAARSVEVQVAPKVSRFLTATAKRIEPARPVKARRRWPTTMLLTGLTLGAAGYLMYRNNSQQWEDSVREPADASTWSSTGQETAGTAVSQDSRRSSSATRVQETSSTNKAS